MIIYVRWAGQRFEDGYEVWDRHTKTWTAILAHDVHAFLQVGGAVHMNPSFIPKDEQ